MLHQFQIDHLFDSFAEHKRLQSPRLPFTLRNFHKLSNLRKNGPFGKNFLHLHFVSAKLERLLYFPKKILVFKQILLLKSLRVNQSHHSLTQIIVGFLVIQTKSALRLSRIAKRPLRSLNPHQNQQTRLHSKQPSTDSSSVVQGTTSQ